jgi:hypothetical protein
MRRRSNHPVDVTTKELQMTDQVAIVAQIRPGKRADLERILAEGPPFDLEAEGFEHHEVFLGDGDVVFVFTGPGAATQLRRLAATPEMFRQVIRMTGVLSAPRFLQQTFRWDRAVTTSGDRS